jgi:hypothetical protein
MLFGQSMKKVLASRGYRHCKSDEEFTRHGDYARNMQFAFSKEHQRGRSKIVDIVFLSADLLSERLVIGFFRENVSIENGVLVNSDVSVPLTKFSIEEFEKQLDRLIPAGDPLRRNSPSSEQF